MQTAYQVPDDEVNADLCERFSNLPLSSHDSIPNDNIPTSRHSIANDDIREYFAMLKKPIHGGSWLKKPEIPSPSEILRNNLGTVYSKQETLIEVEECIRPHKLEGAYQNIEDYLRTKYELAREDAIRPLCEVVAEVRVDPFKDEAEYQNNSIGIYDPVYITSLVFSPRGLATRVAFSLNRVKKHIRWEQSKRLITGTLVALSPADDAFQTQCVLATVAARPLSALDQNPPEIDLFFARPEDQEIDPMRRWIMLECRASFFEASRHTLLALQHMMREPFPLSEYLVNIQKKVEPPAYIQHNPFVDLSSLVSMEESRNFENVNVLEDWPATSSHSLDRSQSKALKRMLTSRLAIVQGPPGTGKTHVSVVALQILRDNLRKHDAPIIVTAQTNHAVDQILRHTMEYEPNFIRLGGRSKDKDIKKRTLFQLRSEIPGKKQPGSHKVQAIIAMKKLTNACQMLLAPLEANKPPLDHRVLLKLGLITEEQAQSLELESQFTMGVSSTEIPGILVEQWLGRCLAPCIRPVQPDDYGLGFEEEDYDMEQLQETEAEAVQDDDDLEALRGPVTLLNDNYKGKGVSLLTSEDVKKILAVEGDLTKISSADRGAIYNFFMREVKKMLVIEVRKIAKEYEIAVLSRKVGLWNEDLRLLSETRIIGCTTTGLSKYRALISATRARIVLVEEAAETQESPVTAACVPSLQHLILVGDHLQLRPHTQVHAFEDEPYFLNLSLFERLVTNEVEYDTLTRQRRMIPEIRRLLVPIYHNTLKDHESVKDPCNRPPVEGMGGKNTFFFCHEWPESRDGNMSAFNAREGDMIVKFFDYLVLNTVDPARITVLTFYNGQRKFITRRIREHPNLRAHPGIKVVTVDSYQGEENDIVLLSLVRSNKQHNIGFLASDNRACVALSRAKRGFYIFGNAELLACESGTWAAVVEIMYGRKTKSKVEAGQMRRLGYSLPLECSNHNRKTWVEDIVDFDYLHGGCDLDCDGILPCQHKCTFRCHPFEHDRVNCTQKCSRHVESCGHPCAALCCDPCKCQICEHRANGVKSMLRSASTRPSSFQVSHPRTRNLLLDNSFQVPSTPILPAMATPNVESTTKQWDAYASGGIQADDLRVRQKRRAEEEQFLMAVRNSTSPAEQSSAPTKLIQVSPEKVVRSKNTSVLLDLDDETGCQPTQSHQSMTTVSYATVATSAGENLGKADMNLLD
ncbi:P-loop containing nucleoside triphosphate hydrolase protein [Pyrenochaeta sp. MPI-SDFR-AT-0127]|nr:P-loop containing nucleoside triphosphate hydrolase protein [Pyrenochaeta sp. MPI-SDFR-AT-0127]